MNTIKTAAEDLAVAIIVNIRNILTPVFDKYAAYYKYINFFIYGVYAVVLFGFYNTVPEYIPILRNVILYTAVVILLLRFNTISWTNPKFSILGGTTFSEFDRRLIISTCVFILITHIVSETVINYTKNQFQKRLIQPVSGGVIHPVYNIIDGAGASATAAKAAMMPAI
jgi:hypothetical protein